MEEIKFRVFLIGEDEDDCVIINNHLTSIYGDKYALNRETSYQPALEAVKRQECDIYLVDLHIGTHNGLELMQAASAKGCMKPMILLTGRGSQVVDFEGIKAESVDYLDRNQLNAQTLERSIRHAIKQSKTMEKLLKEKEKTSDLFEGIVETMNDGIMVENDYGIVVFANKALVEMLRYENEKEIYRRPWSDFFSLEDDKKIEKKGKACFESALVASDGKIVPILISSSSFYFKGKYLGVLSVIKDITERKKAEEALEQYKDHLEEMVKKRTVQLENTTEKLKEEIIERKKVKTSEDEAREYAESIINTVREPLIALDHDLRVVKVSRSFYEFFKVNPEETVGQLIYDLGNKQWDIPRLRELLETILPQKTAFDNYVVEHDFATIGRRIMLLNARQIERVSGKERIILLAIEDITERREIEKGLNTAHEELKELATELKRAARVKAEFLANMSHELRTPLNSIIGFSEVLDDETFGPINEKQKKYVNNVLTSGKHLLLLINQILDMAKVEAGKMNLNLSILPLKSILNDISMLIADMVSKKKIEMSLEIAKDLPDIEADDLKVKQIIYNLLSNAVKFTPDGGRIGMRANKCDAGIEVVVWDTGVGIAHENMEKIFEGFFRVETPFSRVTEGTGLGLPLSKKLVELHGGKFTVESSGLNKGASVRFTLPVVSGKVV